MRPGVDSSGKFIGASSNLAGFITSSFNLSAATADPMAAYRSGTSYAGIFANKGYERGLEQRREERRQEILQAGTQPTQPTQQPSMMSSIQVLSQQIGNSNFFVAENTGTDNTKGRKLNTVS